MTVYCGAQLKSTPPDARSLSMNLLLGKLYVNEGLQNKAEESYMAALRQNPYALEAVLALTELAAAKDASPDAFAGSDGAPKTGGNARSTGAATSGACVRQHEIERFYTDIATTPKAEDKGLSRMDATWIQTLVAAHMDAERGNHRSTSQSNDLGFYSLLEPP